MKRFFTAILILILITAHSVPSCAEQDNWLCTQCGADASGNFCSNCGASRESAAAPTEDPAAGDSEEPEDEDAEDIIGQLSRVFDEIDGK